MLSDLFHALRRGFDQLRYFRHTYSPLSPWKARVDALVAETEREAARYGIKTSIDRRRAYQVARMVVPNRHGEHLSDLLVDAYLAYSPPSAATFHAGRRRYGAPIERRAAFRRHPQTLAYLLTPPKLSRLGIGGSGAGCLSVIDPGESEVTVERLVARLQKAVDGRASDADLRAYAEILTRLQAGVPAVAAQEPAAA